MNCKNCGHTILLNHKKEWRHIDEYEIYTLIKDCVIRSRGFGKGVICGCKDPQPAQE